MIKLPKYKNLSEEFLTLYTKRLKEIEVEFQELGYDLLVGAGNLLAILRNNDLYLPNDDDFDLYVVLKSTTRSEIKEELKALNKHFRDAGQLEEDDNWLGQAHIFPKDKDFYSDIWALFFENDRAYLYNVVYGNLSKEVFLPYKIVNVRGHDWKIPNQPEKLMSFLYGEWETELPLKPAFYPIDWYFNGEKT